MIEAVIDIGITQTDWSGVLQGLAALTTALAVLYAAVMGKRNNRHLKEIGPKVTAIDTAVNGQQPGTPPMVENVIGISAEQDRVKEELADVHGTASEHQWKTLNDTLVKILEAVTVKGYQCTE